MHFVFDLKIVVHVLKWFVNKIQFQYMYSLFMQRISLFIIQFKIIKNEHLYIYNTG